VFASGFLAGVIVGGLTIWFRCVEPTLNIMCQDTNRST
jgi:hypothetical protein